MRLKPSMWCLTLHQSVWAIDDSTDATYCPACEEDFYYPTKKQDEPVYEC